MKLFYSFIILLSFLSCNNKSAHDKDDKVLIPTDSIFQRNEDIAIHNSAMKIALNEDINTFILDFIKSADDIDCVYELYIDKKTENEYFVSLFSLPGDSNYFIKHSPINYTVLNDKLVFVYTGLEDFIDKNIYEPRIEQKEYCSKSDVPYNSISMVIKKDTSYVVGSIGLPFSNIDFLPPIHIRE